MEEKYGDKEEIWEKGKLLMVKEGYWWSKDEDECEEKRYKEKRHKGDQ